MKSMFRRGLFALIVCATSLIPYDVLAQDAATQASVDKEAVCRYSPFVSRFRQYDQLVSASDPYVGSFDAPVTVIEYFDPNCGHCKEFHPVMEKLMDRYGDQARFFMIPFVLWPHSLGQIEALYVAAAKGKYYEMLGAQFDAQKSGGLTIEEIEVLADGIGIDPEWIRARIEEGRHQEEIIDRRRQIVELGVPGTPTIMINGRFVTDASAKTEACISQLIETELSESLD